MQPGRLETSIGLVSLLWGKGRRKGRDVWGQIEVSVVSEGVEWGLGQTLPSQGRTQDSHGSSRAAGEDSFHPCRHPGKAWWEGGGAHVPTSACGAGQAAAEGWD